MPFSMFSVQVVLGGYYRMIFRLGKQSYHYFPGWRIDGTWEQINHNLDQWVRASEDREASASAAILDSQSMKTATFASIFAANGRSFYLRSKHSFNVVTAGITSFSDILYNNTYDFAKILIKLATAFTAIHPIK